MAPNVSGIFQPIVLRSRLSWDGGAFMLGIIFVKYQVGKGERERMPVSVCACACTCVSSTHFERICLIYMREVQVVIDSPWDLGKLALLFCSGNK